MDPEHANTIPISEILGKLEVRPLNQQGSIVYYPSLWDRKRGAMLVVDTTTNRWSDATGKQGTLMELVCRYLAFRLEAHTEVDALRWIKNMTVSVDGCLSTMSHPAIELRQKKGIHYPGLVYYLQREGIALSLAQQYLKEIHARNRQTGNAFIALGLPTVDGGFSLRTAYLERYIGQPAISFIRGNVIKPKGLHVFKEGMDYLCLLSHIGQTTLEEDVIVLNAWSCLSQVPAYIHQYGYQTLYSWLDNTEQGRQAITCLDRYLQTEEGLRHQPMNKLYTDQPSVHAWYRYQYRHRLLV